MKWWSERQKDKEKKDGKMDIWAGKKDETGGWMCKGMHGIVEGCKRVKEWRIIVLSYCKGHTSGAFYSTVKH